MISSAGVKLRINEPYEHGGGFISRSLTSLTSKFFASETFKVVKLFNHTQI
jgi:hypothetical protein